MRKSLLLVGIPAAAVGVAIAVAIGARMSATTPVDSFAEELKRADALGLELAQSQSANKYAFNETMPEAKPDQGTTIRRGTGPKAIRSATPTVRATPDAAVAESIEDLPQVQVIQTAAAPSPVEATAPAIPRPVPASEPAPSEDEGPILAGGAGRGAGTGGGGMGGGMGGIFGVVIRGGHVDGDNCDPRPRGSNGARPPMRGGTYSGNPNSPAGARSVGNTTSRPATPTFSAPGGPVQARTRGGR